MPLLSELVPGQRACVTAVEGTDAIGQRLMEMGVLEGERVELVRYAPLGDPIEIRLHDYTLSLRKTEASRVHVSLD